MDGDAEPWTSVFGCLDGFVSADGAVAGSVMAGAGWADEGAFAMLSFLTLLLVSVLGVVAGFGDGVGAGAASGLSGGAVITGFGLAGAAGAGSDFFSAGFAAGTTTFFSSAFGGVTGGFFDSSTFGGIACGFGVSLILSAAGLAGGCAAGAGEGVGGVMALEGVVA